MNNLMIMQSNTNEELTMTHLQFAEITGKRNDNVKRVMESLEKQGIISITQIEEPQSRGGKVTTIFHVNERDSYIVMAQLSPEFTAQLVDEWKAMKENKTIALPDFNDPAIAARAWADQFEQRVLALKEVEVKTSFNSRTSSKSAVCRRCN